MAFNYTARCTAKGCSNVAIYKIAARWTDGLTEELKTYGLSCKKCLASVFKQSMEKQKHCRLVDGEMLECPGIFELQPFKHDKQLQRLAELEWELSR